MALAKRLLNTPLPPHPDVTITAWKTKLPPHKGLDNHEMIRAVHDGKLKVIYLKGEDTITSDANAGDVGKALREVDFLVAPILDCRQCH